jgi:hypothetical protein
MSVLLAYRLGREFSVGVLLRLIGGEWWWLTDSK